MSHRVTPRASLALFVLVVLVAGWPSSQASAEEAEGGGVSHRIALAGGFDARLRPDPGGHGYGLIAYDLEGLAADSRLHASYNTDTIRLAFDRIRPGRGVMEFGFRFTYEFTFAGLLPDYFRDGLLDEGRGFNAGYLELNGYLKAHLPRDHYLEVNLNVRRWLFSRTEMTDPALTLPPDLWSVSPWLYYSFWRVRDDPSIREAHRLFPRIHGANFGVGLGLDWRSEYARFGALDPEAFEVIDPRNNGDDSIFLFRQWLRAGYQISDYFRIQVAQSIGFGREEDDLTRTRIGGMNPYVVPLAGAPWAAVLADLYVAIQVSLHIRFFREMELGILADGIALKDPHRIGDREMGFLGGLGAFADLRFGAFQLDIRGGWTPSLGYDRLGHWNIFGAFGWQWASR